MAEAAWARSYATTWSASTEPVVARWPSARCTTSRASSTADAAAARSGTVIAGGGGQVAERRMHDVAGELDGGCGGVDVGHGHGWGRYSATSASVRWRGQRTARGRSR